MQSSLSSSFHTKIPTDRFPILYLHLIPQSLADFFRARATTRCFHSVFRLPRYGNPIVSCENDLFLSLFVNNRGLGPQHFETQPPPHAHGVPAAKVFGRRWVRLSGTRPGQRFPDVQPHAATRSGAACCLCSDCIFSACHPAGLFLLCSKVFLIGRKGSAAREEEHSFEAGLGDVFWVLG